MDRGIYYATMGMLNNLYQLDNIANNLANVNTNGYKKDSVSFKAVMEKEFYSYDGKTQKIKKIGNMETATVVDDVRPVLFSGGFEETGNQYDFAIKGSGFFKIQRGEEFFYTRNGEFKRDSRGFLVTNDGDYVLSRNNGKILINNDFQVLPNGKVSGTDYEVAVFDLNSPKKYGYNLFSGEEVVTSDFKVMQKTLEHSNVDALNEMIKMISASRQFGILEKAVQTSDSLNARIIETVSKI